MNHSHLLLIDDEPEPRGILASWLRQLGARVTEAGDIAGADAALARETFDLILSDVHLPGNDRLQWTERVLARNDMPPLVLLTGNPEVTTAICAANLPIAGYLAKPPHFPTLRDLLQRLIAQHRRQSSLRELAREATRLAALPAGGAGLPAGLGGKLDHLAACLEAEAARHPRETAAAQAVWRQTIAETIVVLEKTRDSFRSKELGRLRQHLRTILAENVPA